METIYMDEKCYNILNKWTADNYRLAKVCIEYSKFYFKKCKLVLDEFYAMCEVTTNGRIKITIHKAPKSSILMKYKSWYSGVSSSGYPHLDGVVECRVPYFSKEAQQELVETFTTAFVNMNVFATYGNITENRDVVLKAKTDKQTSDKIYTFRVFEEKLYCIHTTSRKSPEGIFSVRGHFRRYKDGKVIWIDEYLKGVKDGN